MRGYVRIYKCELMKFVCFNLRKCILICSFGSFQCLSVSWCLNRCCTCQPFAGTYIMVYSQCVCDFQHHVKIYVNLNTHAICKGQPRHLPKAFGSRFYQCFLLYHMLSCKLLASSFPKPMQTQQPNPHSEHIIFTSGDFWL